MHAKLQKYNSVEYDTSFENFVIWMSENDYQNLLESIRPKIVKKITPLWKVILPSGRHTFTLVCLTTRKWVHIKKDLNNL